MFLDRVMRDVRALASLREDAIRREDDFRQLVVTFITLLVIGWVLNNVILSLIGVGRGVLWLIRSCRMSDER